MNLKINDKVILKGFGLGIITEIKTKKFMKEKLTFYNVEYESWDNNNKFNCLVPVNSTEEKIRALLNIKELSLILERFKKCKIEIDQKTWHHKYIHFSNAIREGDFEKSLKVFAELCLSKRMKEQSFGERKTFNTLKNALISEMKEVLGTGDTEKFLIELVDNTLKN